VEVVHPIICVEDLTASLSEEAEVVCLMRLVCQRYMPGTDVGNDLVEEQNYGDVLLNYVWSGRYKTEDIDGIPYCMYDSDA
jgi:hypothetical protein